MGIQLNSKPFDARDPGQFASMPGMPGSSNYSPAGVANARRQARFGQGTNPNAANYNQFLDVNNAENWRGTGQSGTQGAWRGAPGAQGYGFNPDQYANNSRWALGGQGSYGNSVKMPRQGSPRRRNNSQGNLNNPLSNLPQMNQSSNRYGSNY